MKTSVRALLFYILTFVFTIILGGIQQVLKIDAEKIILPQLGPGVAVLVMLVTFRKDNIKLTIAVRGTQTLKYIGAVGIPLLVSVVLFLSYRQFIGQLSIQPISGISLLILLGGMLLGAFGEELGWRGYLQRLVEGKVNVLMASLLVGLLWGLWHVGNYQYGPIWMLFFVLSTLAYSVIMVWLLQGTDYNVTIAWLFHFAVNVGFYILKGVSTDLRLMLLNGIVWVIVAIAIIALNRKDFLPPRKKY
jgi:membrane protease YdiL (CAAX protease family)